MNVIEINRWTGSEKHYEIGSLDELERKNGDDKSIFVDGEPFFECDKGKTEDEVLK